MPGDDRRRAELDTDVETDQRGQEVALRQADVGQHAGAAHAVQQAEAEGDGSPPRMQAAGEQVLEADLGDRQRAQRRRGDAAGPVAIRLDRSGAWMARAVHMAAIEDDPYGEWRSEWTPPTFARE